MVLLAIASALAGCRGSAHNGRSNAATAVVAVPAPAEYAAWPWPGVRSESLHRGVTHWLARSRDGTTADLFAFDFQRNSRLRLELYDQDEDDSAPFDDSAHTWQHGVGWSVKHLTQLGRGPIIAAWNGPFFSADRQGADVIGRHIAPVVLSGRRHYNVGAHRWTFGADYRTDRPRFHLAHLPAYDSLGSLDFGAGGLQRLINDGRPLQIAARPRPGQPTERGSFPSTASDVGHIPLVDHMKTSRASMAWTRDWRRVYLLFITESDNETASALALRHGTPDSGGWDLADLQRFWLSLHVWCAVNSDGGDVAQLAFAQSDRGYMLIPPRWAAPNERLSMRLSSPTFAPGGSLMYWYVREARGHQKRR